MYISSSCVHKKQMRTKLAIVNFLIVSCCFAGIELVTCSKSGALEWHSTMCTLATMQFLLFARRHFSLVVALHADTAQGSFPVVGHVSERIIVRVSLILWTSLTAWCVYFMHWFVFGYVPSNCYCWSWIFTLHTHMQASNPGNFDSDCDYCWLRASNPEVTYHHVSCRHTVISQT